MTKTFPWPPTKRRSPSNTCPASTTSGPIRPSSACSCSPRAAGRWWPRPGSLSCRGKLAAADLKRIKRYCINPVDSREAAMAKPRSLALRAGAPGRRPGLERIHFHAPHAELDRAGQRTGIGHGRGRPALLPGLFPRPGAARPDPDRDPPARHLLVRPLPAHHVFDGHRPGRHRRRAAGTSPCAGLTRAYLETRQPALRRASGRRSA